MLQVFYSLEFLSHNYWKRDIMPLHRQLPVEPIEIRIDIGAHYCTGPDSGQFSLVFYPNSQFFWRLDAKSILCLTSLRRSPCSMDQPTLFIIQMPEIGSAVHSH
jgi:hypothetical protein